MAEVLNAMTVDVEDWFSATILQCSGMVVDPTPVVERNTEELLDFFEEHGVKATWFFLGEVAEAYPRLVSEIVGAGHEPAVHGYHHHQVDGMSSDAFKDSVVRAKDAVEQAGGVEVTGFRAVDFGINTETSFVLDVLLEIGFKYDSSLFPFGGPRYGSSRVPLGPHCIRINGGEIFEVPVTVGEILGFRLPATGGGYFRMFPLWYTRMLFRLAHSAGRSVVFYLHPCEIERETTLDSLPSGLTLQQCDCVKKLFRSQSKNRGNGRSKLKRIFSKYAFGSVRDVFDID